MVRGFSDFIHLAQNLKLNEGFRRLIVAGIVARLKIAISPVDFSLETRKKLEFFRQKLTEKNRLPYFMEGAN